MNQVESPQVRRPNNWLNLQAKSVASQCGEDGIIKAALEVLRETNKWCVEFGAWDGKHLSNTFDPGGRLGQLMFRLNW